MKAAKISEIKKEVSQLPQADLVELCLRMAKFKKENKELLTYLLFNAHDEHEYIEQIKLEITHDFSEINCNSYFYMKKSARKILRNIKKYARYSKQKSTEVELLLYFCREMLQLKPAIAKDIILKNIYLRQREAIRKLIPALHDDLQYDYLRELEELTDFND